ncbi:MAG TPA: outer membrane beta-barrel protein [Saprospiraceae bacterium]|nr:outer membrane beta-barrel protein [Saprospiraceae bacterium]
MKTLATILMIFTFSTLFSQKGTFYLGGSAGLISSSSKTGSNPSNKSTDWALSPEIGTWISDNLQTGVAINFGGSSSEGSSASYFGATLYARNYWKAGQSFRPFVGLNIGAGVEKVTISNRIGEISDNVFGANLMAGFGYSLSEKWTVIGSFGFLGYETRTSKNLSGVETTFSDFGLDVSTLGNRFNVGFYYNF